MALRNPMPIFTSNTEGRVALLQGLLIGALVIAGLYVGREVLLPLVVAILLSFVLTPPLLLLRRLKVPHIPAVILVVALGSLVIFSLGWVLAEQGTQLAENFPRYQAALSEKVRVLRKSAESSGLIERASEAVKSLERMAQLDDGLDAPASGVAPSAKKQPDPLPVEIREAEPEPLEILQEVAGTVLPPLATAGLIVLFMIFILMQREDLRDRLIRLMAPSDLQRATATMTDAANRLSRYFLSQVLINASYGAFIGLALWAIGVPSPVGFGIFAMLMRFVPYIGSFIAAAPPMLLAAVVDPGWTTVLGVGALFLVSELIMGQVVEPLVYGHGTGLSPIAVVIATVFWTWLWGPLGLLLAMPLTVCLVVLGRHVDELKFLEVLLGDAPALTPAQGFYQRTLIGDPAEATYHAEMSLKAGNPLVSYLDDVALEGLRMAQRDADRGVLDTVRMQRIKTTVAEVMDDLSEYEPRRWFRKVVEQPLPGNGRPPEGNGEMVGGLASLNIAEKEEEEHLRVLEPAELAPGWEDEEAILCIGARTALDEAAAAMLAGVLARYGLKVTVLGDALSAGSIVSLESSKTKLVWLSYLAAGGGETQIRYLIRRLRRILPAGATVLVGYWTGDPEGSAFRAVEKTAGADAYATTLTDAAEICVRAAQGLSPEEGKNTPRVA
jgi:predicted PurR-regulated permease PerM